MKREKDQNETSTQEERKLRPIPQGQVRVQELKNITARFIEEIDRICMDGRVKNINTLEADLLLPKAAISKYAKGVLVVDAGVIQRAKRIYNIDLTYVIMNASDPEHAGPIHRRTDLRKYEPFNRKEMSKYVRKDLREKQAD